MKTVIIANPMAGAGKVGRRWQNFNRIINSCFGPAQVRFTQGPADATRVARQAAREGCERLVVVGGDGTLNEAVNGLFSEDGMTSLGADISLVLYPVGTGGDFARSVGLSALPVQRALEIATDRRIDLGRTTLTAPDGSTIVRHFINISSFGASGLIDQKVNASSKLLGGKASFMWGTLRGLLAYKNQRVRLTVDDIFDQEVLINTVAVANGRFFGGSMKIAPDALVDDGLFDIVILGDLGLATFLRYSSYIYKGRHLELPAVSVMRGRTLTATPLYPTPVLIDFDGEQPGQLPVRYEVMPKALKLFAPWEHAEGAMRDPANSVKSRIDA